MVILLFFVQAIGFSRMVNVGYGGLNDEERAYWNIGAGVY